MAEHNDLGKLGEDKAVSFLEAKGYEILERNFQFQKAEIDIIAQFQNELIVVEVKTRSSLAFGLPQEFITPSKIKLLVKAINQYVEIKNSDINIRFDIISVYKNKTNQFEIEHIENAFYHF